MFGFWQPTSPNPYAHDICSYLKNMLYPNEPKYTKSMRGLKDKLMYIDIHDGQLSLEENSFDYKLVSLNDDLKQRLIEYIPYMTNPIAQSIPMLLDLVNSKDKLIQINPIMDSDLIVYLFPIGANSNIYGLLKQLAKNIQIAIMESCLNMTLGDTNKMDSSMESAAGILYGLKDALIFENRWFPTTYNKNEWISETYESSYNLYRRTNDMFRLYTKLIYFVVPRNGKSILEYHIDKNRKIPEPIKLYNPCDCKDITISNLCLRGENLC